MRHFPTLLRHEVRMMAVAPSTYVSAVLFLCVMGLFYYFELYVYSDPTLETPTQLPSTLYYKLFWIPVFFMVPLLTMKTLAEERRQGTLEAQLGTPASALEIVLGKFFAAYLFYLVLWALTLLFPWIANEYLPAGREDAPLVDLASLLGGYLFVACSGLLYIALGVFASSLSRSTLVAGMLSFSMLFVLIISGGLLMQLPLDDLPAFGWLAPALEYMNTFKHLDDFTRGVVDTRPFFLYASNTLLVLGVTTLVVESRNGA